MKPSFRGTDARVRCMGSSFRGTDARVRCMGPSARGTDARVPRTKPSERGTDVPVRHDPRRALGVGDPLLVLAAGVWFAAPWARFTPGGSGSVCHPLPGCRKNEKWVPDPGRGHTAV